MSVPAPRRHLLPIVGGVVALIVVAFLVRWVVGTGRRGGSVSTDTGDAGPGRGFQAVTLYFSDPEGPDLAAERRDLVLEEEGGSLVASTLEALAGGSQGRLGRTLPDGTRVRHVFVDRDGTVYADFSADLQRGMRGAALSQEILLYRSIARTLTVNFHGLRRLVILVEGRAVDSLGGHFDVGQPLTLSEWN